MRFLNKGEKRCKRWWKLVKKIGQKWNEKMLFFANSDCREKEPSQISTGIRVSHAPANYSNLNHSIVFSLNLPHKWPYLCQVITSWIHSARNSNSDRLSSFEMLHRSRTCYLTHYKWLSALPMVYWMCVCVWSIRVDMSTFLRQYR